MNRSGDIASVAPDDGAAAEAAWRIVCVTGPAGAGRTTAIHALEDMGHEAIANMPLDLVPRLIDGPAPGRPIALGLDVRTRGFSIAGFLDLAAALDADPKVAFTLVYLDCAPEALLRRYSETRRRHPAAPDDHPEDGITREIALLGPVRERADIVINTSDLTPHDLRAEVGRWFGGQARAGLAVSLQSFSYKRGMPRGLDMVFDCRFLRNPHWAPALRPRDGRDAEVAAHVRADPRFAAFLAQVQGLVEFLLPAHAEEGRAHLAIGFGCTGGQHRSVMMVETLARALAAGGWQVSKRHRELESKGRTAGQGEGGAAADRTGIG